MTESAPESIKRFKPVPHSIDCTLGFIDELRNLPGCIVECGVYKGDGLATIAWHMYATGDSRFIYGYDSFEGLSPSAVDLVAFSRFDFKDGSYEETLSKLPPNQQTIVTPGPFSETLPLHNQPIAVLILDCDLYESYQTALTHLWPELLPGGVVILDEYGRPEKWPGAKQAVDEFCMKEGIRPQYVDWFDWPEAPRYILSKE